MAKAKTKRQRSHGTGSLFRRTDGGCWIASWYDHAGKRREKSTRTTDRVAAARILAKHVEHAALRIAGVVDARTDAYTAAARRPLAEHVEDWRPCCYRGETHRSTLANRYRKRSRCWSDARQHIGRTCRHRLCKRAFAMFARREA